MYLQDEVEAALHPTLTRCWCPKGRRGQRLVEAPGTNDKRSGFGLLIRIQRLSKATPSLTPRD